MPKTSWEDFTEAVQAEAGPHWTADSDTQAEATKDWRALDASSKASVKQLYGDSDRALELLLAQTVNLKEAAALAQAVADLETRLTGSDRESLDPELPDSIVSVIVDTMAPSPLTMIKEISAVQVRRARGGNTGPVGKWASKRDQIDYWQAVRVEESCAKGHADAVISMSPLPDDSSSSSSSNSASSNRNSWEQFKQVLERDSALQRRWRQLDAAVQNKVKRCYQLSDKAVALLQNSQFKAAAPLVHEAMALNAYLTGEGGDGVLQGQLADAVMNAVQPSLLEEVYSAIEKVQDAAIQRHLRYTASVTLTEWQIDQAGVELRRLGAQ